MRIIERFLSIQGEGVFSGRRAYFLRLAGCNFRCAGFGVAGFYDERATLGCDTQRATYGAKNSTKISAQEVLQEIYAINPKPLVIITGGEPLLQQNSAEFCRLISGLKGYEIQFETNGTIELSSRTQELLAAARTHFAIGFKLKNSGEKNRLKTRALKSIFKVAKTVFFKVVLSAQAAQKVAEYEEIFRLIAANNSHDFGVLASVKNPHDFGVSSFCELESLCARDDEYFAQIAQILRFIRAHNLNASLDDELAELAILRCLFARAMIFLMPQGANRSELSRNAKSVAELAIRLGFEYSDRLHIRLWDDLEGV